MTRFYDMMISPGQTIQRIAPGQPISPHADIYMADISWFDTDDSRDDLREAIKGTRKPVIADNRTGSIHIQGHTDADAATCLAGQLDQIHAKSTRTGSDHGILVHLTDDEKLKYNLGLYKEFKDTLPLMGIFYQGSKNIHTVIDAMTGDIQSHYTPLILEVPLPTALTVKNTYPSVFRTTKFL